jgi:hypothetical protein
MITTPIRLRVILLLLFAATAVFCHTGLAQAERSQAFTAEQWLEDLDFVVMQLQSHHPNLHYRISQQDFAAVVEQSREEIRHARSDLAAYFAIKRTVASIQDVHTQLWEGGAFPLSDLRFPVRFDRFADGIFITVIAKQYEHALGARVIALNGTPVEEVLAVVDASTNADNEFGRIHPNLTAITLARFMYGLGIADGVDEIELDVIPMRGEPTTLILESVADTSGISWFNRMNVGPTEGEYVHAAALLGDDTPLHMKWRGRDGVFYWFDHLAEEKALYVQLNQVANQPGNDESLAQFTDRVWSYVDEHAAEVDKLIIDLRYNDGGNALRIIPFVNEIIKRDFINDRESLFVLVGNRTNSAAVIFLTELLFHTNPVVLGEPPACPFNFFSNSVLRGNLPNSGFQLRIASRQIDNSWSNDTVYYRPHIPAPFSSSDYFGGEDPALEIVLHGDTRTIMERAVDDGAEAAFRHHVRQRQQYADLEWWRGRDTDGLERQINQRGYALMRGGRINGAFELFKLNTLLFPESWNAWDSLGEVYYNMSEFELSLECYRKSVGLNPSNENGRRWIERIVGRIGVAIALRDHVGPEQQAV